MDRANFESWMQAYGRAWEGRDPKAAIDLFSEDAAYYETPFGSPMRGLSAIEKYWDHIPVSQEKIEFDYEVVTTLERVGIARWRASFVRIPSKVAVKLDGIALVTFDDHDRCTEFREWWHREERK